MTSAVRRPGTVHGVGAPSFRSFVDEAKLASFVDEAKLARAASRDPEDALAARNGRAPSASGSSAGARLGGPPSGGAGRWLVLAALALTGCPFENSDPGADDGERCAPKDEKECSCGERSGTSVCTSAGRWGSCTCPIEAIETRDASGDAANRDAGQRDASARSDAGKELDSGALSPPGTPHALPCEVAAILSARCGECHGEQTEFGAPMSLVSWEDLQAPAPKHPRQTNFQLALERAKSDAQPMPPAPYERLNEAELATLSQWIEAGTPQGEGNCEPPDGASDGGAPPETAVPKPDDCARTYELTAHGGTSAEDGSKFTTSATPALSGNQYQCFYFDPPYPAQDGMFWFEPILDNTALLHHWILYATDNKTQPSGTSAGCNANQPGSYFVAGWAPGADHSIVPEDVSLQLPSGPNAGLILEVHYYNDTGEPQQDASGIRFCTGPQSERAQVATVHTLGTEAICVEPLAPGEASGTCSPRTDMGDIHIVGIWPHMHRIGRHMSLSLNRADGGAETLHDEPFDFNAQIFYPKDDVIVRPGDTITTTCSYQNDTTGRVPYGETTQAEMCYAFVLAWPAGALASPPSLLGIESSFFALNRCSDEPLSIERSCNGLADAPMNVEHP